MSASSACNIEEGAITSFLHTFSELLPDVESFDDVALSAALDGRNPALLITLYSALLCPLLQRQKPLATWSDIESKLFPAIRARRNRMLGDIPPLQAMQNWPRELQARVISNLCDWVAEEHADFRNSTSRSEPIGTDAQQRNYYYFADGSAHFRIYRLDVNDSSWSLCCRTSEEMEELARSLRHRSMNAAALADYVEHTLLPDLNRKHEAKLRAASRISRLGLSVQNIMSERPRRAGART